MLPSKALTQDRDQIQRRPMSRKIQERIIWHMAYGHTKRAFDNGRRDNVVLSDGHATLLHGQDNIVAGSVRASHPCRDRRRHCLHALGRSPGGDCPCLPQWRKRGAIAERLPLRVARGWSWTMRPWQTNRTPIP
jgi:hypothetical protein